MLSWREGKVDTELAEFMVDHNLRLTPQTNVSLAGTIKLQGTRLARHPIDSYGWKVLGACWILLGSVDPALRSAAVACKPELHRMGLAVRTRKEAC